MAKDNNTSQSLDQVIDGVHELIELFEDLSKRVNAIELIIEGKPSQNIPSLHKDVQELKITTEKIRITLEDNFIKDLISLKNVIAQNEQILIKDRNLLDNKLIGIETKLTELKEQIEKMEKDVISVKDKTTYFESFIEKFKAIPSFITWVIPIISLIVIIFINFIIPYILKWK